MYISFKSSCYSPVNCQNSTAKERKRKWEKGIQHQFSERNKVTEKEWKRGPERSVNERRTRFLVYTRTLTTLQTSTQVMLQCVCLTLCQNSEYESFTDACKLLPECLTHTRIWQELQCLPHPPQAHLSVRNTEV